MVKAYVKPVAQPAPVETVAWVVHEEGSWVRIDTGGEVWDEPMNGWSELLDTTNGQRYYQHTDGRKFKAGQTQYAPVR